MTTSVKFEQEALPYSYDSLEPYIDAQTMEIHYTKHHAGYVNKLNKALEDFDKGELSLKEILNNISQFPDAVRNNAGGHYNHSLFWKVMGSDCGGEPGPEFMKQIIQDFGGLTNFINEFEEAAKSRFGSGWAWLIVKDNGSLAVTSTPNQDNPLMDVVEERGTPILGLDVWEHAYYLKYQNKRPDYVSNFWNVVNWNQVESNYYAAKR